MPQHPHLNDLALFASGDAPRLRRYSLARHAAQCEECRAKIAEFQDLRSGIADELEPDVNWGRLASEMRANIRLGLEAGECVRSTGTTVHWRLGLAAAFACVLVLAGAGYFLRDAPTASATSATQAAILRTTSAGVELRTGSNSLTLLNREGASSSQTVSAQGSVRSRYIDGETGAVTINNVYLAE